MDHIYERSDKMRDHYQKWLFNPLLYEIFYEVISSDILEIIITELYIENKFPKSKYNLL